MIDYDPSTHISVGAEKARIKEARKNGQTLIIGDDIACCALMTTCDIPCRRKESPTCELVKVIAPDYPENGICDFRIAPEA